EPRQGMIAALGRGSAEFAASEPSRGIGEIALEKFGLADQGRDFTARCARLKRFLYGHFGRDALAALQRQGRFRQTVSRWRGCARGTERERRRNHHRDAEVSSASHTASADRTALGGLSRGDVQYWRCFPRCGRARGG